MFNVENTTPQGDQRTIGYWKNWNSCSHDGAFVARAAKTGNHLLDEFLPIYLGGATATSDPQGDGVDPLVIDTCAEAVKILNKQQLNNSKSASDAAYGLAAQLLAAKANVAAGAGTCSGALTAIVDADKLLDKINFNGTGTYLKGNSADRALALSLASTLDQYNNGNLCP